MTVDCPSCAEPIHVTGSIWLGPGDHPPHTLRPTDESAASHAACFAA